MKALVIVILMSSSIGIWSEEWVDNATSTASLRTYGAFIVSSDSVEIEENKIALITYWEAPRGKEDRDFYRCVDIVLDNFKEQSQQCWKVKTPTGRRAIVE